MAPLVLAPLLIAAVLVASGVGKLLDPGSARAAFVRLHVPPSLSRPWMQRALPWAELALALALLVTPGPWRLVGALAATALLIAYTWLIWRALRSGEEASCQCFGTFTSGRITRWTLARNLSLVAVSLAGLADALAPVPPIIRAVQPDVVGWILGAIVVGWVVLTIAHEPARAEDDVASTSPTTTDAVDDVEGDYLRLPIPYGELEGPDGGRYQLRELTGHGAVLLVWLSLGCGSCQRVIDELPAWRQRLGVVDVRPVFWRADGVAERLPDFAQGALLDPHGHAQEMFGVRGTPMAVLLGADGLLAGGPVAGSSGVEQLVEDMIAQLSEADVEAPAS